MPLRASKDVRKLCSRNSSSERLSLKPRLRLLFVRKSDTDKLRLGERRSNEGQAEGCAWGRVHSKRTR